MRKVTEITTKALAECRSKKLGNSEVCPGFATWDYYLFDNLIAMYNPVKKQLWISDAGWQSNTTKERLNGILRQFGLGRILQKDYTWYFAGSEGIQQWTGKMDFSL